MENVAVVLASGMGKRFGGEIAKQFVEINGKLVVEYSVDVFSSFGEIEKVLVVCGAGHQEFVRDVFRKNAKVEVIEGGLERSDSARKAIDWLAQMPPKNVLLHDAARPLASKQIIQNCLNELKNYEAVLVAVPVLQTVSFVEGEQIVEIPKRENVFVHQTPQCFRFKVIQNALNKSNELFTDDISAVFGKCKIKIVKGSVDNIKITNQQDVTIVKEILRKV